MFKSFVVIVAFALSGVARAESLHPCTPTVQAAPTYISCNFKEAYVSITIETLMSPGIEMCQGPNHVEIKTANLTLSDKSGRLLTEIRIHDGGFSYTGSPTGDATFKSDLIGISYDDCVTPLPGGFSVGN